MTPGRNPGGKVQRLIAGEGAEGQRLDNFLLRELAGVPRSRVYRLLRKGEVRVNGKRKQPDYRLAAADEVRLPPVRDLPDAPAAPRRVPDALVETVRQSIVHEDARLLVLNKPAGLAVHGGSGLAFGAIEALRALRPDGAARARAPPRSRHERLPAGGAHPRRVANHSRVAARGSRREALRNARRRPLAAGTSRPSTRRC